MCWFLFRKRIITAECASCASNVEERYFACAFTTAPHLRAYSITLEHEMLAVAVATHTHTHCLSSESNRTLVFEKTLRTHHLARAFTRSTAHINRIWARTVAPRQPPATASAIVQYGNDCYAQHKKIPNILHDYYKTMQLTNAMYLLSICR